MRTKRHAVRTTSTVIAAAACLSFPAAVALANAAPVVSQVTASQKPDGSKKVEIRYNLADADGDACTVTVQVSSDGGATWTVPATALTGAIGPGVTRGTGKLITWDSKIDLPGASGSQFRVRVCADDSAMTNMLVNGNFVQPDPPTLGGPCIEIDPGGTNPGPPSNWTSAGTGSFSRNSNVFGQMGTGICSSTTGPNYGTPIAPFDGYYASRWNGGSLNGYVYQTVTSGVSSGTYYSLTGKWANALFGSQPAQMTITMEVRDGTDPQAGTFSSVTDTVSLGVYHNFTPFNVVHQAGATSLTVVWRFTKTGGWSDFIATHVDDIVLSVVGDESPSSGMVLIPAGSFQMGDTFNEGGIDEFPVHTVALDAFYIDRYEVTNQRYADALNWAKSQGNLITVTGGVVYKYNSGTSYPYCSTTSAPTGSPNWGEYSRITWNGTTFSVVAGKADHPMAVVSWYGAAAHANWRSAMEGRQPCYDLSTWVCNFNANGYRLPTEAEWEKAARGGVAGHRFPWSDSSNIQHARANYYSSSSYSYDTSPTRGYHPTFSTGGPPYTSPVGYFAPNGYGVYDMAGNVWEWCNDWYGSTYYSASPSSNPLGPPSGTYRVLRGGSWGYLAYGVRCARRYGDAPGYRSGDGGFRLALDSP